MSPPGTLTRPTLSGERIAAGHDLETRNGQRRYLCAELGIGQREARLMIAAYEADVADAKRIGNSSPSLSDHAYLDRLMRQAPGGRRPRAVPKREWRVTSG